MYKIPANTLFIAKTVHYVSECHSTNTLALELAQQSATSEGTVVITNKQTAGRGQRGNQWEAAAGMNLTFSVILKPSFLAIADQFYLNIITTLAIRDYLIEKTASEINIKWPNDILAGRKKLCGILIESQLQGNKISNSVIGIGLNINQAEFNIARATSLTQLTGITFDLEKEFVTLTEKLEVRYLQLRSQQHKTLLQDYLKDLYQLGEKKIYKSADGTEFLGIITGIDTLGRLSMETEKGVSVFDFKQVSYVID